ncbi:MAG TPA: hypothetical protein VJ979_02410 [Actinomycetota bacterium]|nr:hypothetical protein [Actinomycetota bacterium]
MFIAIISTGNVGGAGPLSSARILEAMGALDIFLNMQGGSWQNAWKLVEPAA